MPTILDIKGVGPALAKELAKLGILNSEQLATLQAEDLLTVSGVGPARAMQLIAAAKASVQGNSPDEEVNTEQVPSSAEEQTKASTIVIPVRLAEGKSKPKISKGDRVTKSLKKEVRKRQAALKKQKEKLKLAKKALKEAR